MPDSDATLSDSPVSVAYRIAFVREPFIWHPNLHRLMIGLAFLAIIDENILDEDVESSLQEQ